MRLDEKAGGNWPAAMKDEQLSETVTVDRKQLRPRELVANR